VLLEVALLLKRSAAGHAAAVAAALLLMLARSTGVGSIVCSACRCCSCALDQQAGDDDLYTVSFSFDGAGGDLVVGRCE